MATTGKEGYIASLQQLEKDLNLSISRAFPNGRKPYEQASVLFLKWDNDDIGVSTAEDRLAFVFYQIYGFTVEYFVIPSNKTSRYAKRMLYRATLDFVERFDSEDSLLVLVYNGHASVKDSTCFWRGARDSQIELDWMGIRRIGDIADGEVLYILDCCCAATAAIGSHTELLAAASWDGEASADPHINLTTVLAQTMEETGGRPVSVAQLYARIVREADQNLLSTTPVHAELSEKGSIILGRLGDSISKEFVFPQAAALKVLVTAKLVDPMILPDKYQWEKFLTTCIPEHVEHLGLRIQLEGFYESNSAVIQISLPIEVFTCLSKLGPYNFTAFIKSSNALISEGKAAVVSKTVFTPMTSVHDQ